MHETIGRMRDASGLPATEYGRDAAESAAPAGGVIHG